VRAGWRSLSRPQPRWRQRPAGLPCRGRQWCCRTGRLPTVPAQGRWLHAGSQRWNAGNRGTQQVCQHGNIHQPEPAKGAVLPTLESDPTPEKIQIQVGRHKPLTLKVCDGCQPLVLHSRPGGSHRLGLALPGGHKVLRKVALQASLLPAPGAGHRSQGGGRVDSVFAGRQQKEAGRSLAKHKQALAAPV
jgi:hypothetical protein